MKYQVHPLSVCPSHPSQFAQSRVLFCSVLSLRFDPLVQSQEELGVPDDVDLRLVDAVWNAGKRVEEEVVPAQPWVGNTSSKECHGELSDSKELRQPDNYRPNHVFCCTGRCAPQLPCNAG